MAKWLDNADSWVCSNCNFETNNPNKLKDGPNKCPKCGSIMDNGSPHIIDNSADINLYVYIRENSCNMPHNTLYYYLLDWADKHQELQEHVVNRYESYTINYIENNQVKEKIFRASVENPNPFITAKKFLSLLKKDNPNLIYEFWLNANPYRHSVYRGGNLIESNE